MKKKLALLLSLLTLAQAVLSACTSNTPADTEDTAATEAATESESEKATETESEKATESASESATEAKTETETAKPTEPAEPTATTDLAVIKDGKTDYRITVAESAKSKVKTELDWLIKVMKEKYGAAPEIVDAASLTDADKRISLTVDKKDDENRIDYEVSFDEKGNITVRGGHTASLAYAIYEFGSQYCGKSDGNLIINTADKIKYYYATDKLDNSSLLKYTESSKENLSPSNSKNTFMTPTWFESAVMVELRVDMADIGGRFDQSLDLIDFYAEAGVNVLWLTPVYERGAGGNGYGNIGVHTIANGLTGKTKYEDGWLVLKDFVDYAHSKGIYILLDIITWGSMPSSSLYTEHPEWYDGISGWGFPAYNWENEEFVEWFITESVKNIAVTGADGYRCDCEPAYAGYDVFGEIRERLAEQGKYVVIMSEDGSDREKAVFDCEQDGVLYYKMLSRGQLYQTPKNFFVDGILDIVKSTKNGTGLGIESQQSNTKLCGTGRFYTNCITNHDYQKRDVLGNRLKIGYAAIYAPYIPLWYMGDEFGAEGTGVLYDLKVNYSLLSSAKGVENLIFYEDVKEMIKIRRSYPEIFEYWPLNHRESNIVEVEIDGFSRFTNYARYADNKIIVIAANNRKNSTGVGSVTIPFDCLEREYATYTVTDLLSGKVIASGTKAEVDGFSIVVPYQYNGVYLVEGK